MSTPRLHRYGTLGGEADGQAHAGHHGGARSSTAGQQRKGVTWTTSIAVPARTQGGWSVLLCRFNDVAATPQAPAFFSRMFGAAGRGTGGLYDYYADQSYGKLRLSATVRGWYTMPYTVAQEAAKCRWDRIGDCVAAAVSAGYTVPVGNRIAVITNAQRTPVRRAIGCCSTQRPGTCASPLTRCGTATGSPLVLRRHDVSERILVGPPGPVRRPWDEHECHEHCTR